MKIAHVYQEPGIRLSEPHAAQIHIYHTIRGLQQAGHEVSLLALQGRRVLCTQDLGVFENDTRAAGHYAPLGVSGTPLFQFFESGVRRLQATLRLPYLALFDSYRMAEAASRNLRGCHVIHERFNLLALGGAWASARLGLPLVLEVNADLLEQRTFKGSPETGLRRLLAMWATRASFRAAAKIICISEGLKRHLSSRWNIQESRLAVLPCAADVEAFGPQPDSDLVRRRLGLTREPVVMWVGGFFPWHDLDLLLESFTLVLHQHPDARLVLVGDGQTRSSVEEKARENGLRHAVIMAGPVPHTRVAEMLSIADVAVVPSAPLTAGRGGTGTPLKLFEYMAAGKAIVATALKEAAEVIQDGENGLLVEPGDAQAFASAIAALLSDAAKRARLGNNARRRTEEQFSWEHYTQRLEDVYRDVVAQRP